MTITIRDAGRSDLADITTIYGESVENGVASYELQAPSLEEMTSRFEALTNGGFPYVVAVNAEGRVLGYAYAGAYRTRPAYRWSVEDSVYLSSDAHGQGIGKKLLAELIARCTRLGFRQMIAVIGGAHPASVSLHRSMGFNHCGTIAGSGFKHGRWLDTDIMQLALGDGKASVPQSEPGVTR